MNILVTGAGGLVGRRLVPALAASHHVWAVSRRQPDDPVPAGVEWIHGDLTSPALIPQLPDAADVVVHLAQSPRYAEFPAGALDVFAVNAGSTARLLDWAAAASVKHFVLTSSGAVVLPGHERSYYAASKKSAELMAACYAHLFGVLVLRCFFIYGAGQRSGMLVPRLIETIQSGGEVRIAGPDGSTLNPVHVDDVVAAIVCAVDRKVTGTVDVAGPEILTIRRMSDVIGGLLNVTPRFAQADGDVPADLSGDITMLRQQLAAPRRRFEQGVADVIVALEAKTK
jgi:nucleoside-diphosphate-sugar epimerase